MGEIMGKPSVGISASNTSQEVVIHKIRNNSKSIEEIMILNLFIAIFLKLSGLDSSSRTIGLI
jgi:hypothetical protein